MTFFESLLILLAVAVAVLPFSRRLAIPYPTMLAAAGVALAALPNSPTIHLDPATALPLFIAPALCDGAFEFPVSALRRFWRPLISYALVAVVLTTAAVAVLGVYGAGLPVYAAVALGAIVAPPDAVAATAVLGSVRMPRRTVTILKGESLLNDATALVLFTAAVSLQTDPGADHALAMHLTLAVPGGLLLGYGVAHALMHLLKHFEGVLSAFLLEYLACFGAWILAEHLQLSAVLCVVAFAMTLARATRLRLPARLRIQNLAVSRTSVFLLNVLAFLLMGLQARSLLDTMSSDRLRGALLFAGAVVLCVIAVRMAWVMFYNRLAFRFPMLRGDFPASSIRQGLLTGWCGMRGLVTLATALALPESFPERDLIILSAFAVVLATLVVQGLTLAPLVRWMKLDGDDGLNEELISARASMAAEGLAALQNEKGPAAEHWRSDLETLQASLAPGGDFGEIRERRRLGLLTIRRQREHLEALYEAQRVGPEAYAVLQEDLDFSEVALTSDCERRIQEG